MDVVISGVHIDYESQNKASEVNTIPSVKKIFTHEAANIKIGDVRVREIKILDQYGKHYANSVKRFQTSKSICGYVVSAIAPLLAEWTSYMMQVKDLNEIFKTLNDPKFIVPQVEGAMEIIQGQRAEYLLKYGHEFKNKREQNAYMTDWVATYEISDVFQITAPKLRNLFFLRYCSFEFPDLLKDVKHEELRRLKEEEPFKGQRFIMESFFEKRKLNTIDQWTIQNHRKQMQERDKALVFAGDLKGHFVTFVACKVLLEDGNIEDTLFLINSVDQNYLSYQEAIFTLCQLTFPESVFNS
jgi:hypothetical protein